MNSRQRRTERRKKGETEAEAEVEAVFENVLPYVEEPFKQVRASDWFLYGAVSSLIVFTTFIMLWLQFAYWPELRDHNRLMSEAMEEVTLARAEVAEAADAVEDAIALCP